MSRTSLAPRLEALIIRNEVSDEAEDWPGQKRELRALVRAARVMRRFLRRGNYRMPYARWSEMVDADAALTRAARQRKERRR